MSKIKGIKVGSTNIISTYSELDSQSPLEIVPVKLEVIYKPDDSIYTGYEQKPEPIVKAIVDGELVSLENNIDYTLSYQNNKNVGTATITATGIGNFNGEISTNWRILPANIDVIAPDQSYVYDGEKHGNGITISYIDGDVTINYSLTNGSSIPQIKNVSDSTIVTYEVSIPNHNTVSGQYELRIEPRIVTLKWGESSWVYDGEFHSAKCEITNLVNNDKCELYYVNNIIKDIGSNDIYIDGLSNNNYTLPVDDTIYHTITIKPGMFYKVYGNWTPVKSVYKKVSGSWVKQELNSSFSTSGNYVKKNNHK